METQEIFKKLTPIFREVLDQDSLVLTPELTAHDVADWDSLSHIRLVVSVEELFNVKFPLTRVAELKNVGEFVALIQESL